MAVDILIVDDEADIREILASVVEDEGYHARQAANSHEALTAIQQQKPNLIVLDVWLKNSELDGVGILERVVDMYDDVPVIMISGHGTVDLAVAATKKGAYDFLSKPFKTDALLHTIARGLEAHSLKKDNQMLQAKLGLGDMDLIGNSDFVKNIQTRITHLASSPDPVCILGERGTGKEIVSRQLFVRSNYRGQYVVVNCAIEDDVNTVIFGSMHPRKTSAFEQASGGMLVLNKIHALSESQHLKIAHYLKTGEVTTVDGAKITTTTRVVCIAPDKSHIADALYARIADTTLQMKPFTDRCEDIPALVVQLMTYRAKSKGMTPLVFADDVLPYLSEYHWRGNAWQIIAMLDTLLLSAKDMDVVDISMVKTALSGNMEEVPFDWGAVLKMDIRTAREEFEKWYLQYQLTRHHGNVSETAHNIKMDRASLSRKIKALKLR